MRTAKDEIIHMLLGMSYRKRVDMFRDFIESFAIRLNLAADKNMAEIRLKRFKEIMNRHSQEDREVFAKLGKLLIEALRQEAVDGPADVLSEIYHTAGLDDKTLGESFTPPDVALLVSELCASKDSMFKQIKAKGHIPLHDCCAGAGGLFIAFAKTMYKNKLNYCTQLVVEGWDIDLISVCMAYIQLTLNGIPAKLLHKNTITLEEFSVWHTLTYVTGSWELRRQCNF